MAFAFYFNCAKLAGFRNIWNPSVLAETSVHKGCFRKHSRKACFEKASQTSISEHIQGRLELSFTDLSSLR